MPLLAGLLLYAVPVSSQSEQATGRSRPATPAEFQSAVERIQSTRFLPLGASEARSAARSVEPGSRYDAIVGDEVYRYLEELTAFSQESKAAGDVLWGRVQGGPYERRATEYVERYFKAWGLEDVRIERFPLTAGVWLPTAVGLEVMSGEAGGGVGAFRLESATTAFPSATTPEDGVVAPVEFVGLGSPAELRGRDLTGKVALVYVRIFNGVLLHSGHAAAERIMNETDAAGLILWLDLPGNARYATQLYTPTGWIDEIPWVSVGFHDGLYLRKLVEAAPADAPPKVRLTVQGELKREGTSQNLVGVLRGTSDENLILTAHIDGYWNATLDNGTGVASLMALARYYSTLAAEERKRNLIFLVTGDHELLGAGGSAVFQRSHPGVVADSVLALQLEHLVAPSVANFLNTHRRTNATEPMVVFSSNGSEAVIEVFRDAVNLYDLTVVDSVTLGTAGDVDGLTDVPSGGFIQTGFLYHSDLDSPEWFSLKDLEDVTRAHAYIVDRLNALPASEIRRGTREPLAPIYSSPDFLTLTSPW